MSRLCPCTSQRAFASCCEPFLLGKRFPETPEQLMRSRFSAYALLRADYLVQTTAEVERVKLDRDEVAAYCRSVKCISLKILKASGTAQDEEGTVLFHASLQINGRRMLHRELSRFARENGRWVYVDGDTN